MAQFLSHEMLDQYARLSQSTVFSASGLLELDEFIRSGVLRPLQGSCVRQKARLSVVKYRNLIQ